MFCNKTNVRIAKAIVFTTLETVTQIIDNALSLVRILSLSLFNESFELET